MTDETTAGVELKGCPFCGASAAQGLTKVQHDQLHGEPFQRFEVWCPHHCARINRVNRAQAVAAWNTRAEQPRPTEIRDPILRLFIEEILRQTPNGEAIRVKYHPNGEWSVLPEATGKADAGLAERLRTAQAKVLAPYVAGWCLPDILDRLAALTAGADGGSRQPAPRADDALGVHSMHQIESYVCQAFSGIIGAPQALDAISDVVSAALASDEPIAAKGD